MKLLDVVSKHKTQKEVSDAILKGSVQVTTTDVLDLCKTLANPSKKLCELLLKYGTEKQRTETVAFIVGLIVEYKTVRNMQADTYEYAEILLEHLHDADEAAIAAAEAAIAAATTPKGK